MPVAITLEELAAPPSTLRKKPWTRQDCEAVERTGTFEGKRYELIEGERIDKTGSNEPHAVFLQVIYEWLMQVFARRVRVQMPIDVSPEDNPTSEPQPDVHARS